MGQHKTSKDAKILKNRWPKNWSKVNRRSWNVKEDKKGRVFRKILVKEHLTNQRFLFCKNVQFAKKNPAKFYLVASLASLCFFYQLISKKRFFTKTLLAEISTFIKGNIGLVIHVLNVTKKLIVSSLQTTKQIF